MASSVSSSRDHPIELVDVIEIDPLKPEALQRLVEVIGDLSSTERCVARRAAMRIADLGRDLRIPNERGVLFAKPFAEHDLAHSAAIGVRGVEPPKPDSACMIEQLKPLFLAVARASQARRRTDATDIAAAENDSFEVGVREHRATFHARP